MAFRIPPGMPNLLSSILAKAVLIGNTIQESEFCGDTHSFDAGSHEGAVSNASLPKPCVRRFMHDQRCHVRYRQTANVLQYAGIQRCPVLWAGRHEVYPLEIAPNAVQSQWIDGLNELQSTAPVIEKAVSSLIERINER